jgi:hypothetical protein
MTDAQTREVGATTVAMNLEQHTTAHPTPQSPPPHWGST